MANSAYPKWKYHGSCEALVVQTEAQERILGSEWKDSPADFDKISSQSAEDEKPKLKAKK